MNTWTYNVHGIQFPRLIRCFGPNRSLFNCTRTDQPDHDLFLWRRRIFAAHRHRLLHSFYCPLTLHCCTCWMIWMTQMSGGNCPKKMCAIKLHLCKSILLSWEKGIQYRSTFTSLFNDLAVIVAQLRRRRGLSTCWQVCLNSTMLYCLGGSSSGSAQDGNT